MKLTFHKQITKTANAGIIIPLYMFHRDIVNLAIDNKHKLSESIVASYGSPTFLTFQNGDRIDVKHD